MSGQEAELRIPRRFGRRVPALAALALPCAAGLVYLAMFGAPLNLIAMNGAALALGLVWIAAGGVSGNALVRRALCALLLGVLAAPMFGGPPVEGVTRWISLGPVQLHSGSLAIPLLACLAARERRLAALILLAAVVLAALQPDAASVLALLCASAGLGIAQRDWKTGAVGLIAAVAAFGAHARGILPPQAFTERVLTELLLAAPLAALGLVLALLASLLLILGKIDQDAPPRHALAGVLAGFTLAGILADYPSILIGYGASPILGFALALAITRKSSDISAAVRTTG